MANPIYEENQFGHKMKKSWIYHTNGFKQKELILSNSYCFVDLDFFILPSTNESYCEGIQSLPQTLIF